MSKYDHFYSIEDREAMADELLDRESDPKETNEHHAVDDGYCSCGVLCETGTRFRQHLRRVDSHQGGKKQA